VLASLLFFAAPMARAATPAPDDTSAVAELQREAQSLAPLATTQLGRRFLAGTDALPHVAPRTVFYDSTRTRYWSASEAQALPPAVRDSMLTRTLDESFYYTTRYGSPLAYLRPLELLAATRDFGDVAGRKIVDFGYGTIGHLRLLAGLGAEMVGIEVDPLLRALYREPGDQGRIGSGEKAGWVRLVHGQFPGGPGILGAVGGNVDIFLSKNTLKNGYLHPAEKVDPRRLVHSRRERQRVRRDALLHSEARRARDDLQPVPGARATRQALHPVGRRAVPVPGRDVEARRLRRERVRS
jgi:hypothetical protein